ncbi:MAG: hypothetical protein ACI97X_001698, partial [Oceanospirillaceae bacterium]
MEESPGHTPTNTDQQDIDQNILELVKKQVGPRAIEFILKHVPDLAGEKTVLIDTSSRFNIL